MASMEIQCVGRQGVVMLFLSNLSSHAYCFELAVRLLKFGVVRNCRCRNGGFVIEIDRQGYRTVRDQSFGIGV